MPLVWIPATLCVGLLIAAVYLGGRILTANSHASSSPVQTSVPVQTREPAQAKPAAAQAAPAIPADIPSPPVQASSPPTAEAPKLVAGEHVPMIDPQAGERYIQVAALNLEATRRYVGQLREAKLAPHVAPGPKPELLRVLIGPFADQDSLTQKKRELELAGIDSFVRRY
jgi:cell division septation protein DedD